MYEKLIIDNDLLEKVLLSQINFEEGFKKFREDNPNKDIEISDFKIIVMEYMSRDLNQDTTAILSLNIKYSKYTLTCEELLKQGSNTREEKSDIRHAWKDVVSSGTSLSTCLEDFSDLLGDATESELKDLKKSRRDIEGINR